MIVYCKKKSKQNKTHPNARTTRGQGAGGVYPRRLPPLENKPNTPQTGATRGEGFTYGAGGQAGKGEGENEGKGQGGKSQGAWVGQGWYQVEGGKRGQQGQGGAHGQQGQGGMQSSQGRYHENLSYQARPQTQQPRVGLNTWSGDAHAPYVLPDPPTQLDPAPSRRQLYTDH